MPVSNNRAQTALTSVAPAPARLPAPVAAPAPAQTPAAAQVAPSAEATATVTGFLASGLGIALFSSAIFGLSGSFAKALLETGWTPGAAVTARLTGAALILAIPAVLALRGRWHQLRSNWLTILLFGLIGVAGCQLFYFNAVARLSVGLAMRRTWSALTRSRPSRPKDWCVPRRRRRRSGGCPGSQNHERP